MMKARHDPKNRENAASKLRELGVEVLPAPEDRPHVAFQFPTMSNGRVSADRSSQHFREEFINGRFVNPIGYRQDVHEVLRKYRLVSDWWDEQTIDVYVDPNAAGWAHGYKLYLSEVDEAARTGVVRLPSDECGAILAARFSEDEGIAAFQWDGRDPAFKDLPLGENLHAMETTPLPARPILLGILVQLVFSAVAHDHDLSSAKDEFYKLKWVDHGGLR